jgi:hypothetical protein
MTLSVIPANAGIQTSPGIPHDLLLDSRFRGNDDS